MRNYQEFLIIPCIFLYFPFIFLIFSYIVPVKNVLKQRPVFLSPPPSSCDLPLYVRSSSLLPPSALCAAAECIGLLVSSLRWLRWIALN